MQSDYKNSLQLLARWLILQSHKQTGATEMDTKELRSFFNHNLTDEAADEIELLELQNDRMRNLLNECVTTLRMLSPHTQKLQEAINKVLNGGAQ